ncbi:8716b0f8-ba8a-4b3c-b96f-23ca604ede58 [Thermothielavioides terrestris]|uniref:8716b0f8-ba8a-4b3c-b96f-23ca604ede58 n=1 Tax=Thermothielavioides terrestris TaxID=2587410 RepID=A0A446BC67_9PEZI|nr:8716b0f8-ba8a-4b3c-b96f-23ca604ede58 [Thermothielavioides terrestris]
MNRVTEFLAGIRGLVLEQNGAELRNWLVVENDAASAYYEMGNQLRASFPADSPELEKLVDRCLPEEDSVPEGKGSPWPGFKSFIKEYLEYWRDVDFEDVLRLHAQLSALLVSCANALANPSYGTLLLQTSLSLSESLSKLVMNLNRQPQLREQIEGPAADEEAGVSNPRFAQPKGKKVAVYLFANLTLKLLFACDKSRLAMQMFTNLSASGPPLSFYPAPQRVTFLYYLGRFSYHHGHYLRAHMCLEEAYRQCPPRFQKHRRKILTYWIPANLLLARFPSAALLQRPEAAGFGDIFLPICAAVRSGNFVAFHQALARSRDWLWDKRFYLDFLYKLKPLVWRSFTRKTFMLTWQGPTDGPSNILPALALDDLVTTAGYVQKLLEGYVPAGPGAPSPPDSVLVPPPGGPRHLMPSEGLIFGNKRPDLDSMESVVAGLVYSGLLNGFISRPSKRFAVEGAKKMGGNAVAAGWPNPHQTILERFREAHEEAVQTFQRERAQGNKNAEPPGELDDVPGWVRGLP